MCSQGELWGVSQVLTGGDILALQGRLYNNSSVKHEA